MTAATVAQWFTAGFATGVLVDIAIHRFINRKR